MQERKECRGFLAGKKRMKGFYYQSQAVED